VDALKFLALVAADDSSGLLVSEDYHGADFSSWADDALELERQFVGFFRFCRGL
tara:strand:- start:49 stop:210 length:162 start_codon:yes stop_codon:yes gene_type:complete